MALFFFIKISMTIRFSKSKQHLLRKGRAVLVLTMLLISVRLHAQLGSDNRAVNTQADNLIPPSPEAAALGKYVSIPVSLYTGTPRINIPLYDVQEGDIMLSVSLSYHSSGHKVDEIASRAGMGWTLNAGGVITRTIMGGADEYGYNGFLTFSKSIQPDNFYKGTNEEQFNRFNSIINCNDAQPDQFTFNVNGLSGQFAFDWNRQIQVGADRKMTIRPLQIPEPGSNDFIKGWELIADDGTIYLFEACETSDMRISGVYSCHYTKPPVTSWFLTKITSPAGRVVTFSYENYSMSYDMRISESALYQNGWKFSFPSVRKERMTIQGKHLSQINTSAGLTIHFLKGDTLRKDIPGASSGTYPLRGILITNQNGQCIKRFQHNYDYSTGRLTLTSIQELSSADVDKELKPPYRFAYNGVLPEMNRYTIVGYFQQDHWGYLNGNTKETLLPSFYTTIDGMSVVYEGANREASACGGCYGLLKEIKYPTGGFTSFDFEGHQYGFIGKMPMQAYDSVQRQASVSHAGSSEGEFSITPFSVERVMSSIYFRIDSRYCSTTGFAGTTLGPKVWLLDSSGTIIKYWYYGSSEANYIQSGNLSLPPGRYFLKAWAGKNHCTEFINGNVADVGWDAAQAQLYWYEPTRLRWINKIAGGARIKRIIDHDGISETNNVVRNYSYVMPQEDTLISSGVIFKEPQYNYGTYINEGIADYHYNPVFYMARVSSNAVALGTTQGSHIGYAKVTVLYGNDGKGGKSESFYTSISDFSDGINYSFPFAPPTSYDYKRGLLKKQIDYKYQGGEYIPVKQVDNEYDEALTCVPGYKVGIAVGGGGPFGAAFLSRYAHGSYTFNLGLSKLKSIRTTFFENSRSFVTEQSFSYDTALLFLLKSVQFTSNNRQIITEYSYPFQYSLFKGNIGKLQQRHIHSPVIEKITRERDDAGVERVIAACYTRYGLFNGNLLPETELKLDIKEPIADFHSSVDNNGYWDTRYYKEDIYYTRYHTGGNPEQISTFGGDTVAYLWAYNGTSLLAKIVNASFASCAYTSFENGDKGNWLYTDDAGNYVEDSRTGKLSYKGTIYSEALPAGQYIVSLWCKGTAGSTITVNGVNKAVDGYWKRCQWLVTDAGKITIQTNGNLIDELRLHPKEARMTTYSYFQGVGVTAVTDENHITAFYEYDGLGRLKIVRDTEDNIRSHYLYQYK